MPRLRVHPRDFQVEEVALYEPSGEGSETWLWIEKQERNTEDVARALAHAVGVEPAKVGFAGRKDRRAVTRQWFSVPAPARHFEGLGLEGLELSGVTILDRQPHTHGLRLGDLKGNRFRLRLREVNAAEAQAAADALVTIAERGLPNAFGQQRFGRQRFGRQRGERHANNVERGAEILRRILAGQGGRRGARRRDRFFLSALQAAVFNRVLDRRHDSFDALIPGDLALDPRGGLTMVTALAPDPKTVDERLRRFELSPTGPLFGSKLRPTRGEAAAIEDAALADLDLAPMQQLQVDLSRNRRFRLTGARRPLRIPVTVDWNHQVDEEVFDMEFELPPGSYATVLVERLFPDNLEEVLGDHPGDDVDNIEDNDEEH